MPPRSPATSAQEKLTAVDDRNNQNVHELEDLVRRFAHLHVKQ